MSDQIDYASLSNSDVTTMSEPELELGLTCDILSVGRINYLYQTVFNHINCNELQIKGAIESSGEVYDPTSCNQLAGAIDQRINELTQGEQNAVLYVDTVGGDDSNDGATIATPFKTLNANNLINKVKATGQSLAAELELYAVGDIIDSRIDYAQPVRLKKATSGTIKIKSDLVQGLVVDSDLIIEDVFDWENGEDGTTGGTGGDFPFLLISVDGSVSIEADQNFRANNTTAIICEGSLTFLGFTMNIFNQPTGADQLREFLRINRGSVICLSTIFEQLTDFNVFISLFRCQNFSVFEARQVLGVTTKYNSNSNIITGRAILADNSIFDKLGIDFNPTGTVADTEISGNLIRP